MLSKFSLFQSHLDLAHHYWKLCVAKGDTIIDATCGNGHDSLVLAQYALEDGEGTLFCLDLQQQALEKAKNLLDTHLSTEQQKRVHYVSGCHSTFPQEIPAESVKLIVYNLGYLPGSDKSLTTKTDTTLVSLEKAMSLVQAGGAISITCYPGHLEGKTEEEALLKMATELDPAVWSCCHHRWLNRKQSPSLLLLQKRVSSSG